MKYNVLIVGCGSIGALKDIRYDSPCSKNILTHAHAFRNNELTNKLIFHDKHITRAQQAANKWDGICYELLSDVIREEKPDIIVVAVDTEYHYSILHEIYELLIHPNNKTYLPKLIVCEKPFTNSYDEATKINKNYCDIGVPIMVDYSRRFDPSFQRFAIMINNRVYDPIYNTILTYTRGFKRDASHGIDIFNCLFGKADFGLLLERGGAFDDFSKDDPTHAAYLSYEYCPHIFITPVDGRDYDIFDITIYANKSKHCFTDHGKKYRHYIARPELTYGDYDSIANEPLYSEDTQLTEAMFLLTKNAYEHIEKGVPLLCTAQDGIRVHEVLRNLGL